MRKKLSKNQLEIWRSFFGFQGRLFLEVEEKLKNAGAAPLADYSVLITLWFAPDRRLRLSELAQKVSIRKSTLSRLLDRLEAEKLIARENCSADGRGSFALLTQKGLREMAKTWTHYEAVVKERFFEPLSESDQAAMQRLLQKLNEKSLA